MPTSKKFSGTFRKPEPGPSFRAPTEPRVFGPNLETLAMTGDRIKKTVLITGGLTHARVILAKGRPGALLAVPAAFQRFALRRPFEANDVSDSVETPSLE